MFYGGIVSIQEHVQSRQLKECYVYSLSKLDEIDYYVNEEENQSGNRKSWTGRLSFSG